MNITILGIESSCDDTSAAVIQNGFLLSNIIANQKVHEEFGGVVPELASRAHQQNIVPVVEQAIKKAGLTKNDINGIAFTRGPGLLGSLLVGTSFAKGFAFAQNIPMLEVNHLHGHVLAHFVQEPNVEKKLPQFPFLCLLVSGGHSQIVVVKNYFEMEVIGQTIDDAAGEAFDKCGKVMNLPYPSGPVIDRYAKLGNPKAFTFNKPRVGDTDFSFSGLKTSFLYFLKDKMKENSLFIEQNMNDLCASIQFTIVDILMEKLKNAVKLTGIKEIAIGGGVSANSELRSTLAELGKKNNWTVHIPEFKFTTDNAAMIAISGYYKYLKQDFAPLTISPMARMKM